MDTLAELSRVLSERRGADPESSYVASLYAKGLNKILEKVGEEATEVLLASRDLAEAGPADRETATAALAGEVADLWFHTMVMLTHQDVPPARVLEVLNHRSGISGIDEKRSR